MPPPPPFPHLELLERLRLRDPSAWDWLYTAYAPMVFAVAVRKLREADAREVVQIVFTEFLRVVESHLHIENLDGFLHKIAVRRTLDRLRKRLEEEKRYRSLEADSRDDGESGGTNLVDRLSDPHASRPIEAVTRAESARLVRELTTACLKELSPPERMAAELLIGRMRGDHDLAWAEIRDRVRDQHKRVINLARVFEKFRTAFRREWDRLRRQENREVAEALSPWFDTLPGLAGPALAPGAPDPTDVPEC